MIRGENSDSIPIDLTIEILSRLPTKSIARCRCVCKLWKSMLARPYFGELFLTRSSLRPRLLFAVRQFRDGWSFFSSSQPQNLYEKSSSTLVVTADKLMKFPGETRPKVHASLIYFQEKMPIFFEKDKHRVPVICNPSTGQYATLPLPKWIKECTQWTSFLGFDPIDKQFKVLSMTSQLYVEKEPPQILTLGTGNDSWRKIHCPYHRPSGEGICINGVSYYLGDLIDERSRVIVCFDVKCEKFTFIKRDFISHHREAKLVNYKGKLGAITLDENYDSGGIRCSLKLCMWLIEEAELEYFSTWDIYDHHDVYYTVVGATATGEIVLSKNRPSKLFCLVYINPERNTLHTVEIQGFNYHSNKVQVFLDHVEDLKFITMTKTYAATSTYRTFESINKFDSLRHLDDE